MSCAGYRANGVNSNQTAAITDRSREKEMNIQEAKEEIKKTVRAYTARTAAGTFRSRAAGRSRIKSLRPPVGGRNNETESEVRCP